ncbi:MAG: N-acetylmuramic acid 6-phosphate etherase [Pseudomonadota bacterium]
MSTEDIDPRFRDLDLWSDADALAALYQDQVAGLAAVAPALPAIARAVADAAPRLKRGGRLIYVGAGTSARIGVQDGAELPPTFNWPRAQLAFVIAGGESALINAAENAEDSGEDGAARVDALGIGPDDVVIGVAASGNTPFTVAAVWRARERGAMTMGVSNNAGAALLSACDHPVLVQTGAEAVAGSTRLKAGTAQKIVLNLFSTQLMVRLNKTYAGLMVDMRAGNAKLRERSVGMVMRITGAARDVAARAVADADGEVKLAALLARGVPQENAAALLTKHDGNLRLALAETR